MEEGRKEEWKNEIQNAKQLVDLNLEVKWLKKKEEKKRMNV